MHQPHPRHTSLTALIGLVGISVLTGCTTPEHPAGPSRAAAPPVDIHAAPTDLKTTVFRGITLPVAAQGPRQITGAVATGFARTPAGAALAAIHATVRMSLASDDQWDAVGQRMLAAGPQRQAWAIARAQKQLTTVEGARPPVIVGYRIARYSPGRADTEIYSRQPDASLTCNAATVIWEADDWKLLLPNDSHAAPVTAPTVLPADMISLPIR
ncbi:hypothetical protein [Nocardia nova]|uniref:hypothetical protein n=1 Tax=Nocardia nova TaxID=37330 RepID=UPI0033C8DF7A